MDSATGLTTQVEPFIFWSLLLIYGISSGFSGLQWDDLLRFNGSLLGFSTGFMGFNRDFIVILKDFWEVYGASWVHN